MAKLPAEYKEYFLPEFTGIDKLTIRTVPMPALDATSVLVKVHAVSLQYRDIVVASGLYPLPINPGIIPASDMAGEIVAVGSAVTKGYAVGDRVVANFNMPGYLFGDLGAEVDGVLAEYKVFAADDRRLVHMPENLTYEEASVLPCAGLTAFTALTDPVPIKAGDTLLVQGTGGVSVLAAQFALVSGAKVIMTSSSQKKLDEVAKAIGLPSENLINYHTTPDWDKRVLELTGGKGVDHVVEIGGPETLTKSLNCTTKNGAVHITGMLTLILFKTLTVRGIGMGDRKVFDAMNKVVAGTGMKPFVGRTFSFAQAKDAYNAMAAHSHVGKVVIRVSEQ
ncbi:GroES-like protein [Fistulina hepatica ATCC 64428]|uniref:GroES-like protein n=1 Tax=Fistulina hepatica ATCC 64428 TaxID=1128425 RepID=A0A0D7AP98_9AGAR|nr:GroES-like protein [Fistulina hepatica ATCC 64428]